MPECTKSRHTNRTCAACPSLSALPTSTVTMTPSRTHSVPSPSTSSSHTFLITPSVSVSRAPTTSFSQTQSPVPALSPCAAAVVGDCHSFRLYRCIMFEHFCRLFQKSDLQGTAHTSAARPAYHFIGAMPSAMLLIALTCRRTGGKRYSR
jgi:hypothetical protein